MVTYILSTWTNMFVFLFCFCIVGVVFLFDFICYTLQIKTQIEKIKSEIREICISRKIKLLSERGNRKKYVAKIFSAILNLTLFFSAHITSCRLIHFEKFLKYIIRKIKIKSKQQQQKKSLLYR